MVRLLLKRLFVLQFSKYKSTIPAYSLNNKADIHEYCELETPTVNNIKLKLITNIASIKATDRFSTPTT